MVSLLTVTVFKKMMKKMKTLGMLCQELVAVW